MTVNWVKESLAKKAVQPELNFEVTGVKSQHMIGAPFKSRQSRQSLFEGQNFFFDGKWVTQDGIPTKQEIVALVELGGGNVLRSLPSQARRSDMTGNTVVICQTESEVDKCKLPFKKIEMKELFVNIVDFKPIAIGPDGT